MTIYVWSFFWCYCFLGEDATQDIKVLFNKTKTEIRWVKSTYLLIKRMSLYRLLLSQQAVSIPNRGVKRLMNFLVSHWIIDFVSIETHPTSCCFACAIFFVPATNHILRGLKFPSLSFSNLAFWGIALNQKVLIYLNFVTVQYMI